MAKKAAGRKTKRSASGRKRTPSTRRAGAGRRAAGRSGGGSSRSAKAKRNTGRRTAGAKTPTGKRKAGRRASPSATARKRAAGARKRSTAQRGGRGLERTLAQTAATGRSVKGPTNPMRTVRSTGTPSGAGDARHAPGLDRQRKRLREIEENVPTPPSSLDMDRTASAARTGRREMRQARQEHTEVSPELTAGDVDADWGDAYSVGDEAPGGDNPTPDQDRVDDIGKALGVQYDDNEELKASDKIAERDRHRWELDPASSEDYRDRD